MLERWQRARGAKTRALPALIFIACACAAEEFSAADAGAAGAPSGGTGGGSGRGGSGGSAGADAASDAERPAPDAISSDAAPDVRAEGSADVVSGTEQLLPAVAFSVVDGSLDGNGDRFNDDPFDGLVSKVSFQENRAFLEYDLRSLVSRNILSAKLRGTLSSNNAEDVGERVFEVRIYTGNGAADVIDFQATAELVDTVSYTPPLEPSVSFTLDVTVHVRGLLSTGVDFMGVKVLAASSPNFPSILAATTTLDVLR